MEENVGPSLSRFFSCEGQERSARHRVGALRFAVKRKGGVRHYRARFDLLRPTNVYRKRKRGKVHAKFPVREASPAE
jgi:hypothetical protein